jgi:hypothetical protein
MTQSPETIDVRRIEVLRVSSVVQNIYERCATTKKRRLLAGQLARAIAHLSAENPNAGRAPAQFREISDDRLKQELVRLSLLDEKSDVADEAMKIHQPTIVVLADFRFVGAHHAGSDDRVRLVAAAKKALEARAYIRTKAKRSRSRALSSTEIAKSLPLTIAQINERNRVFWEAEKPKAKREQPTRRKVVKGAPVNNRAAAARRMLAEHYKFLTGRRPTMTGRSSDYRAPAGGQFFEFTKSVLAALNIKASPEAQTRQIAYPQRRKAK